MNRVDIFDTIKTMCQGALGGLTFGMYHAYITHKKMDEFNKEMTCKQDKFYKEQNDRIKELNELLKKI